MGIEALGKDVFLNLLTTQLRFQDPLKPMESTEFVAQLAQFRELESALETNKKLSVLVEETVIQNHLGAANLLGKTVEVFGGGISHEVEKTEEVSYTLPADAIEVIIHVKDELGNVVKTLTVKESLKRGSHQVLWDGKDRNGNIASTGNYTYEGAMKDRSGKLLPIAVQTSGEVTGISYEQGGPFATVNGQTVPVGEIIKILK